MPDVFVGEIFARKMLARNIFASTIVCEQLAWKARAGQFVNIKCGDNNILRRPISICGVNDDKVTFVFEIRGVGTRWLSEADKGQELSILGPLGNGFDIPQGDIIVVGGGMGVPPLLFAAQSVRGKVTAVLGFRNLQSVILKHEFDSVCDTVYTATEDGSLGIRAKVTEPLEKFLDIGEYAAVLACGPRAMLKTVAQMCLTRNVPCQVSLEERMACGVGACFVCACATLKDEGEHMSRVCKDGPVFNAAEVIFKEV